MNRVTWKMFWHDILKVFWPLSQNSEAKNQKLFKEKSELFKSTCQDYSQNYEGKNHNCDIKVFHCLLFCFFQDAPLLLCKHGNDLDLIKKLQWYRMWISDWISEWLTGGVKRLIVIKDRDNAATYCLKQSTTTCAFFLEKWEYVTYTQDNSPIQMFPTCTLILQTHYRNLWVVHNKTFCTFHLF